MMLRNAVVLCVVAGFAFCATAQADLVGHWKLDDAPGADPAVDSSAAGNDWPQWATTKGVPGVFGTAFYFNGGWPVYMNMGRTPAWPTTPASFEFAPGESFTAAGWYASNSATGRGTLNMVQKGRFSADALSPAWGIDTQGTATNGIRATLWSSGLVLTAQMASTPTETYFNGSWHHVAGVYDGTTGTLKLYVDGNEEASVTDAAAMGVYWGNSNSTLAAMWDGISPHPNMGEGTLDDLAVWNEALTPTQIGNVVNLGAENYAVPEPSSFAIAAMGLLSLAFARRRRRG